MKLTINGEAREVPDEVGTVLGLLSHLGLADTRVAVEVNGAIVRRASWEGAPVADGDVVEVVQFVGGG
ncbi:MAG: sulfur carrier protein ThiS [Deltaproteobacteria bacterium]|nr:sulfur carrier protein ThiS [Deltaproteobacteria bacterium]